MSRRIPTAALAALALTVGVLYSAPLCAQKQGEIAVKSWSEFRFSGISRQIRDFSCGSASLVILLNGLWQRQLTEEAILQDIRKEYTAEDWKQAENQGLSMLDLRNAARRLGYEAEGVVLQKADLFKLTGPVIVHLNREGYRHFSVFKGIDAPDGNAEVSVWLADPIRGHTTMSIDRFTKLWTGAVLLVWRANESIPQVHALKPLPLANKAVLNSLANTLLAPRVSDALIMR